MVLHVKTEAMQNKKFDLKVNYVGEVEDGYASGITTLSSDYVVARAPESVIGKIASIGIETVSYTHLHRFHQGSGPETNQSDH